MYDEYKTGRYFTSKPEEIESRVFFGDSYVKFINHGQNVEDFATSTDKCIFEMRLYTDNFCVMNILDLINSSYTLLSCNVSMKAEDLRNYVLESQNESSVYRTLLMESAFTYGTQWYHASKMASKAYGTPKKEMAILKYHLAHTFYSLHPIDFELVNYDFDAAYFPSERLTFAYAIIDCYSILEELNLNIKSGEPSTINEGSEWNPDVLEDLTQRLEKNNISAKGNIPWLNRGRYIRPFKSNLISSVNLCKWSDGKEIRDFEISVVDAISELSFIRDKRASHGVGDRVLELALEDLQNAFFLVRHILINYFK